MLLDVNMDRVSAGTPCRRRLLLTRVLTFSFFIMGPKQCLGWISSNANYFIRPTIYNFMTQEDSFGLTEDGDFAIGGLNCFEDGKEKESDDDFAFGLLGRPEVKADVLKDSNERNIDESNIGLTSDGDFLMAGINGEDPEDEPSIDFLSSLNNNPQNLSMDIWNSSPSKSQTESEVPVQLERKEPVRMVERQSPSPLVPDVAITGYDDEDLSSLEEFLRLMIPSLSQADIQKYARGLMSIGYDPDCITSDEIRFEDLEFMKILHKRYFYREVTGDEPPL